MILNKVFQYLAVLLPLVQPFVFIGCFGELRSISAYWETAGQPLFIITNAVVSYFLFNTKHWTLPALFLLILTAFSVTLYPLIHNIAAGGFFVSCIYPMARNAKFRPYVSAYLIAGLVAISAPLCGELIAINIICIYHAHVMVYMRMCKKRVV